MRRLTQIIAVFLLCCAQKAYTQDQGSDIIDPIFLYLKGKLVSKEDLLPVPYAHVINMRTHGGTTSDAQGNFTMEVLNVDSLVVSVVGFRKEYIKIPHNHHPDSLLIIPVEPIRYAIREIEIYGEGRKINIGLPESKITDISPELRGDAFNEKPKWYQGIFTPLSYMQYYASRSEKEKRAVRTAMVSEKEWEYIAQYYNKKTVMELTGLDEDEADNFMIWFNSKSLLNGRHTEYDIRWAIVNEYENYKKEKDEKE